MEMTDDFATYLETLKFRLNEAGHIDPKILLVTCIDLRYPGVIHKQMETAVDGYFHKRYDQLSLSGAGLACVVDFPPSPKPAWRQTFIDQVSISIKLHQIRAVIGCS